MLLIACLAVLSCFGQALAAGRNSIVLRGECQEVYYYPAVGPKQATVLFLPGDGGWRGFAIDMAQALASSGIDVYGWDIKQYLSGFTSSRGALTEKEVQTDAEAMASRLGAGKNRRFVLVGWSQGAAMSVLASAAPALHNLISGVVAIGLPESGVLGWRIADDLTYITRTMPNEARFATAPWIPAIAPLRFGMIHSTTDEYVPADTARRLFSLARDPKRLDLISARGHRYGGKQSDFFRILEDQIKWAAGN